MNYGFDVDVNYPFNLTEWSKARQDKIDQEALANREQLNDILRKFGLLGAYGVDWYKKGKEEELSDTALSKIPPYTPDEMKLIMMGINPRLPGGNINVRGGYNE